jgi:hypothetical protein
VSAALYPALRGPSPNIRTCGGNSLGESGTDARYHRNHGHEALTRRSLIQQQRDRDKPVGGATPEDYHGTPEVPILSRELIQKSSYLVVPGERQAPSGISGQIPTCK